VFLRVDAVKRRRDAAKARAYALVRAGNLLAAGGRYREAVDVLHTAVRVARTACGERSLTYALALNEFGVCCKNLGRLVDAGRAYQTALAILERHRGHDHPDVATVFHNLGGLEHAAGDGLRGEPFAREAVRIRTRTLGRTHPAVADDLTALAALLDQQRKDREAESLYRRALAIYERHFGANHPALAGTLNNLAALLQRTRRRRLAETLYRRALAITTQASGERHVTVAFCQSNLAALLLAQARLEEAEALCRQALTTFRRALGAKHQTTVACLENYEAIVARRRGTRRNGGTSSRGRQPDAARLTGTLNPLCTPFRLVVRESPVHRLGVFADESIPPGHRVIEYTGEKIGRREAKRRWDPTQSALFELDAYWRLDGAVGGSGAEYINHSCAPNLVTRQRARRIFYFSARRIRKGEELSVDYKYDADLPPMPCRCGAATCRGTMNRPRQVKPSR
jgi:tetratricopeptide (TPR) repeat protein